MAGNDSCEHLECIKETGCCLKVAGLRYHHLPEPLVSTLHATVIEHRLHLIGFFKQSLFGAYSKGNAGSLTYFKIASFVPL